MDRPSANMAPPGGWDRAFGQVLEETASFA